MRMRTFGSLAALGGLMFCAATARAADDKGFYVGANLGQSNYADRARIQLGNIPLGADGIDDEDVAWSITAGYRFSRYFAFEAGYVDLGDVSATLTDTSGVTDTVANARFDARGPTLTAIGYLPLGKWSPFIKAGVLFDKVDLRLAGRIGNSSFDLHGEAKDGETVVGGIGTEYEISERWRLKFGLDYYVDVGKGDQTGTASPFTLTLGVTYRF